VSQSSVVRIVNKDLSLKCFKRRRAQELTESNRLTRLVRSRQLLKRYQEHDVAFVWFTGEKIFTVAAPSNSQSDRAYAARDTLKKKIAVKRLLRTRNTFSQSIMISVSVSKLGCTVRSYFSAIQSQKKRCILSRYSSTTETAASDSTCLREVYFPAGQCTCTSCE